jgi:hypothetical protein
MHRTLWQHVLSNLVGYVALFIALGGTAAATTYVVSSNADVAAGTISGHAPPAGDHSNVIGASINNTDLAPNSVTSGKIATNSVNSARIVDGSIGASDLAHAPVNDAGLQDAKGPTGGPSGTCQFNSGNAWLNRSSNVNFRVGYSRDSTGYVHLEGTALRCGAAGTTVFTLPTGFRPEKLSHEAAVRSTPADAESADVVTIGAGGDVVAPNVSQGDSISLDGVTFRCGPSGQSGCP